MGDRNSRLNNWLQVLTNVAIVAGLVIVVYELNQTRQLAHAQIQVDQSMRGTSRSVAVMGEDPREALAKAAFRPEDLVEEDAVTLDAYYNLIVFNWMFLMRVDQIANFDTPWQGVVEGDFNRHFTTGPARRWLIRWLDQGAWGPNVPEHTEYKAIVERLLREDPRPNESRQIYETLLGQSVAPDAASP